MKTLSTTQVKEMTLKIAEKIIMEEPELSSIDRKIGDGDHGIGMKIGFKKVLEELEGKDFVNIGDIFKTTGMAMLNSMGGASGVLFSSFFLGLFKANKGKTILDTEGLAMGLEQALKDVKKKGGADLGDKTMIDALQPAVEILIENMNEPIAIALAKASIAAEAGVEKTKDYMAKFGRAKNLGERAIGYQDAGATSIYLMINEMSTYTKGA
jgi:dihydroxyacetone kinase-like protein